MEKLLKQHRETGTIAPKVRTKQTPTKLNTEQLAVLEQIVAANNDATLDELRHQLEQQTGVLIGRSTTASMLQKLNLTRKKKHCMRPKRGYKNSWQSGQAVIWGYLFASRGAGKTACPLCPGSPSGSERVQQQRVAFWQLVQGILAKDLIFIDESGVNLALTRLFARSFRGERARGQAASRQVASRIVQARN